jgi:hypothetical protein
MALDGSLHRERQEKRRGRFAKVRFSAAFLERFPIFIVRIGQEA